MEDSDKQEIAEFVKRRNKALIELDMNYIRKMLPTAPRGQYLMILHKTRYEVPAMPAELRHASRQWLEERGYSRLAGLPWPPQGELPD